jgi:hypothetical protein
MRRGLGAGCRAKTFQERLSGNRYGDLEGIDRVRDVVVSRTILICLVEPGLHGWVGGRATPLAKLEAGI